MKKLLDKWSSRDTLLKFDLKMKLTMALLLVTFFGLHANDSYSQKTMITLEVQNSTIGRIIDDIEASTEFRFIYKTKDVNLERILSLKVNKEHIQNVLNTLFDGSSTTYKIRGKHIILLPKAPPSKPRKIIEKLETENVQEPVLIKGQVNDDLGNPLPGANIVEKGTLNGTQSDFDGNFSITVADGNATLTISYIGFSTKDIPLEGQTVVSVVLQENLAGLDEVVVTGYTAQSKRTITGAVEIIDSEELVKNPATSVEQQLQGKISGMNIVTSGAPGGASQVRIRGLSTFGNKDPLYIIDGSPSEAGLNEINPDDIATISVLKDASAASIYGARAANGVILITTKKGKKGQETRVTYSSFAGVDVDPGKIDVLNAQQWGEMEWLGQRAAVRGTPNETGFLPSHPTYGNGPNPVIPEFLNGDPSLPYNPDTNRLMRSGDTDWYDAITRVAFSQNHNLNIVGSGENSTYGLSFGYLNREGTALETSFQRYSTRLNTEFTFLNDKIRVGENVTIAYSEQNGNIGVNGFSRQGFHPLIPRFDEGGNFGGTLNGILGLGTNFINPEAQQIRTKNAINRKWRVFGNAFIETEFIENLTFTSRLSIDYIQNNNSRFNPVFVEGGNPGNTLQEASAYNTSLTWTNTVNYKKNFDDHAFDILLGTEAIEIKSKNINFNGTDFFTENLDFVSISTAGRTITLTGAQTGRNLASLFGKLDYSFKNKYLLNMTLRRDGSSALGPNNRFDIFPAIGVGWMLSDETFLENSNLISQLKLRAGWGTVGNQNSLGNFNFISNFSQDPSFISTGYDINASNSGNPANGIALLSRGNPNLVWESSETLNIGMDFSLINNKISGSVEWYDKRTKDLILQPPVPLTSGTAAAPFVNLGEIQNTGVDLSINYRDKIGQLGFDITGVVSTYKNKVIDIDGNPNSFFDGPGGNPNIRAARTLVGGEIGAFYGLIVDGIIQEGPNAGSFDFRDLDNNGTIDFNDEAVIGSPHPDFTYSLNLNAQYKSFDFTLFFRGSQGNDLWEWNRIFSDFQFRDINRSTRVLDAWRPDNPNSKLAEYNLNTSNSNLRGSSYYVQDGSYFKLQTMQIGYSLPELGALKQGRIYLQGQNIFTITKYTGVDPEIGESGGLELGVDRGNVFAVPRTFLIGFNFTF